MVYCELWNDVIWLWFQLICYNITNITKILIFQEINNNFDFFFFFRTRLWEDPVDPKINPDYFFLGSEIRDDGDEVDGDNIEADDDTDKIDDDHDVNDHDKHDYNDNE